MTDRERLRKDLHELNRASWNAATPAHNSHKVDQAGFLRSGGSTLFDDEIELLGEVAGKSLVHLQCNSGQDTLGLVGLGARDVLGVDISDSAVEFATQLSEDSGIPARFERADLYDWFATTDRRFDVAFASYGVFPWLSDLAAWARGVAGVLEPGGRLVTLDFHPAFLMLEDISAGDPAAAELPPLDRLRVRYGYSGGEQVLSDDGIGDYVALSGDALAPQGFQAGVQGFRNPHGCHEFIWGVEDVVGALLDAGLRLTCLRDYPYANGWKPVSWMVDLGDRRFGFPTGIPRLPLMFGLVAERPAS